MQFQLCTVFFTSSLGTRTHYFGRTILHGGARYQAQATGRGFVVRHIKFSENYRLYARSHFAKGMEIVLLLVVYLAYGFSTEWRLYFCWLYILRMALAHVLYRTFFSRLAAGSWLFLGYLHHICLIHLALSGKRRWRTSEIGQTGFCIEVGLELKEKKVWEAWWDEELV
ncbi:unnamed protein product [Cuscuta campestris]|uniref:Glycosyl transferase 48 domain-containing protein n=1 Tax=Cuscuta campestris TaxID=132261 RepID=A0A484N7P2_9ASTE|nr:unnamed protein product [Cuscuta campestris]